MHSTVECSIAGLLSMINCENRSQAVKKKQKRPRDCRGLDAVCALRTDHHDIKGAWILFDGYTVTVKKQNGGESPTGSVSFKPAEFSRLVDWWNRPQTITSDRGEKP